MTGRRVRFPVLLALPLALIAACDETPIPTAVDGRPAVAPQLTQVELPNQILPVAVTLLKANQVSYTGAGVAVGIVDDGFNTGHEDLIINQCVATNYQPYPCAGGWHGNIAAGVLKATDNSVGIRGVAPGVTLRVCKAAGVIQEQAACIDKLKSSVDILSLSWGIGSLSTSDSTTLHNAIKGAYNAGVLIFAEANNRMNGAPQRTPMYPASWPEVVGVSGVMPNGNFADLSFHTTTYYNQYCPPPGTYQNDLNPTEWGDASNYGSFVELAGPFYTISTRQPTPPEYPGLYRHVCGTSFATPAVAGVAALVMQANSSLSRDAVRTLLQETAVYKGSATYYGHGLVDAQAAVSAATAPPPPPPLQVTLDGPATAVEHAAEQCVWQAYPSGGQGTKTYEWYYDYQRVYPNPWAGDDLWYGDTGSEGQHHIHVVVRDDSGAASDEMNVTVDNEWAECGWF